MAHPALDKIETLIPAEQAYAEQAIADARNALGNLSQLDFPYIRSIALSVQPFTKYDLDQPSSRPGPLTVSNPPSVGTINLPVSPPVPDLTIPTMPVITFPVIPGAPSITIPELEDVELGEILTYVIPNAPVIDIPGFAITPPDELKITPQQWSFSIDNILITDDPMVQTIMNRIKANLAGGSGLTPEVEDAIWKRNLERFEQQLADTTDKTTQMWAKKGFTLPDGMLAHSLSENQKEYMNRSLDLSRDIAVEQGKLEQSNLFKSMEIGVNLTSKLIDQLIAYEQLALKVQEDTAQYANEYIRLQIEAHRDAVEVFRIRVMAYDALIKAELAKAEVYKTQIDAALAIVTMNKETVEIYRAETDAAIAKYKGILEGDQILASIFSEQVKAALATAQVDEAIIRAYAEQVRSVLAKAEVYRAEIDGMTAEINAQKAVIDANVAQVSAWAKQADVAIASHAADVDMYKADIQFNVAKAEIFNKVEEAIIRAQIEESRNFLAAVDAQARSAQAAAANTLEAAKSIAHATSTMAAGAMASLSVHTQLGYSEIASVEP